MGQIDGDNNCDTIRTESESVARASCSGPMTMDRREDFAHQAFQRDLRKVRETHDVIVVEKRFIPEGGKLVEAYEYKGQFIICGEPPTEEEYEAANVPEEKRHNCDEMGCSTFSHVIARFRSGLNAELSGGEKNL